MKNPMESSISLFNSEPSKFAVREYNSREKKLVIAYMWAFDFYSAGGKIEDCVTGERFEDEDIGFEDGEFGWSTQDIYHIEKYNAAVSDSFLQKVLEIGDQGLKAIQETVKEMRRGNVQAITDGVRSEDAYIAFHAIMSGAKHQVKERAFIDEVKKHRESQRVMYDIPVKSVAEAAVIYLERRTYTGGNPDVENFINGGFSGYNWQEECKPIVKRSWD